MEFPAFDDRLELLGTALGVFVVVTALGSVLELVRTASPGLPVLFLQVLGIALSIAVGVAVLLVVRMD